jgi:hypothetical protein
MHLNGSISIFLTIIFFSLSSMVCDLGVGNINSGQVSPDLISSRSHELVSIHLYLPIRVASNLITVFSNIIIRWIWCNSPKFIARWNCIINLDENMQISITLSLTRESHLSYLISYPQLSLVQSDYPLTDIHGEK